MITPEDRAVVDRELRRMHPDDALYSYQVEPPTMVAYLLLSLTFLCGLLVGWIVRGV